MTPKEKKAVENIQAAWKKAQSKKEKDRLHASADKIRGFDTTTLKLQDGGLHQVPTIMTKPAIPTISVIKHQPQLKKVVPKLTAPSVKSGVAFADNPYTNKTLEQAAKNFANIFSGLSNEDRQKNYANYQRDVALNTAEGQAQFGFMRGILPANTKPLEKKLLGADVVKTLDESKAAGIGEMVGIGAQFGSAYGAASGKIGAATKAIPAVSKLGALGQGVVKSVATDLAVGLPLNVNYALNKEGLRGTDALKSIGKNTALDLILGGALEFMPVILKSGKKVSSKSDFEKLNINERTEVFQKVEKMKNESLPAIKQDAGKNVPREKTLAENAGKPKETPRNDRLLFDSEYMEKPDREYKQFMDEMSDYALPKTKSGADQHAQAISGKGVTFHKDVQRNADAAFRNSPEGRAWFKNQFEDNFYKSKGEMASATKAKLDTLYTDVVKGLGIRKGSKESAAVQWLGEGKRQVRDDKGKTIGKLSEGYDLERLKQDFPNKAANGKKAWENIVQAEQLSRKIYNEYVEKINEALIKIYPNVEVNVEKLQAKLGRATDATAKKRILQEIEDATVGKRLTPRKDYYRHFKEMESRFIGLDNIINGSTNIDPRLLGVSEFTQPGSKWTGMLQRRKDGDVYTEDAIGGLLEYIPQAEYKIHVEPNIPILRGIIKDLKESTIDSKNANSFIENLMLFTNDLAGKTNKWDRLPATFLGDEKGRKALNVLSTLSNRMRANAVVGNVNTMLAQFFNLPNVVGYAKNPADIVTGYRQSIQASMGNKETQELLKKSDFLRERYLDRSFRRFDKSIANNLNSFFSWTMEIGDKAVADGAWLTFYRQAVKKGIHGDEAIRFADEFTRKSVAGRGIGEMPLSQKAKLTKMFAPFQVEVRNAVNVLTDLGREKDIAGIMGVFVTSFLMNELLERTTGRRITFDPIDVLREGAEKLYDGEDASETANSTALGLMGAAITNYPGGSYIADVGKNIFGINDYKSRELFGENDPSRFGTGNIALQTLGAPIGQKINGQNIDLLKPLANTLPKFGGKQIERAIRGLQDMAVLPRETINFKNDEFTLEKQTFPASYSNSGRLRFALEPSLKNNLIAPTLGTWSTKEGKNYIQQEVKPLGDKKTEAIKALGDKNAVAMEAFVRAFPVKVSEQREIILNSNMTAAQKNKAGEMLVNSDKKVDYSSKVSFEFSMLPKTTKQKYLGPAAKGVKQEDFMAILKTVDVNGNGGVSQDEAQQILDGTKLTKEQKSAMWKAINKGWKHNPYEL